MGAWWITNYDEAKDYLSKGRKKYDRPMYMRGLRLQYRGKDIAIRDKWYNFDPILFHPDGTLTIQAPMTQTNWGGMWNPLNSQGVRYNIRYFGGFQNLYQKNRKIWIVEQDAALTPVKIQKCRQCKGSGLVDGWCSSNYCNKAIPCAEHPEATNDNNGYRTMWHYAPCEHGKYGSHNIPKSQSCHYCSGTGKRDYGSNPIAIEWDGSPIRVKDGKLVKNQPTELERQIANYVAAIS